MSPPEQKDFSPLPYNQKALLLLICGKDESSCRTMERSRALRALGRFRVTRERVSECEKRTVGSLGGSGFMVDSLRTQLILPNLSINLIVVHIIYYIKLHHCLIQRSHYCQCRLASLYAVHNCLFPH